MRMKFSLKPLGHTAFSVMEKLSISEAVHHLRFTQGCRAVIPCPRSHLESFKWLYSSHGDDKPHLILSQDTKGIPMVGSSLPQHRMTRMKALKNGSLAINSMTEEDQGIYTCEVCRNYKCIYANKTSFRLEKGEFI